MNEKIKCFSCGNIFYVDSEARVIYCKRCGTGFERDVLLQKDDVVVVKTEDIVIDVVDDTKSLVNIKEDKPERRKKDTKHEFDAVPSLDD